MNNETLLFIDEPESNSLLVVFSHREAKGFAAYRIAQELKMKVLFIKDPGDKKNGCSWYNGVIKGLSNNADDLFSIIKGIIRDNRVERVVTIGSSMGGYASLLFGTLLNAEKIIAFAPQVVLDGKLPRNPDTNKHDIKYDNLVKSIAESKSEISVFYGADDLIDVYNASLLKGLSNVEIFGVPGFGHRFLDELKEVGFSNKLWKSSIIDGDFLSWLPISNFVDTDESLFLLKDFVYEFYSNKNNKKALDALEKLVALKPMWSTLYHWMALLNYNLQKYSDAIIFADNAIKLGSKTKMNALCKGRALFKLGKYDEAIEALFSCLNAVVKIRYDALVLIGICFFKKSEYKKSIYWQTEAASSYDDNYEALYQLGLCNQMLENNSKAHGWFKKCLESNIKKEWIKDACTRRIEDVRLICV